MGYELWVGARFGDWWMGQNACLWIDLHTIDDIRDTTYDLGGSLREICACLGFRFSGLVFYLQFTSIGHAAEIGG
jgi:hypothetical protein